MGKKAKATPAPKPVLPAAAGGAEEVTPGEVRGQVTEKGQKGFDAPIDREAPVRASLIKELKEILADDAKDDRLAHLILHTGHLAAQVSALAAEGKKKAKA